MVRFGKSKLNIFTEKEYYEGTIDPQNGADWNQAAPLDTKPTVDDFQETVVDYLAWEVSTLLKKRSIGGLSSEKTNALLSKQLQEVQWRPYKMGDLFKPQIITKKLAKKDLSDNFSFPAYSSVTANNGIIGYSKSPEFICGKETPVFVIFGDHTRTFHIATESFSVLDNVKVLLPPTHNIRSLLWITTAWQKQIPDLGYARHWEIAQNCIIDLPTKAGMIDFDFMESFIAELETQNTSNLFLYLTNRNQL